MAHSAPMDAASRLRAAAAATDRLRRLSNHKGEYTARQEQILDRAEAMFLTSGYAATSMDDLAATARCSKNTIYQLAPSKGQLFLLVIDRMWRRLGAAAFEAMAGETTAAGLITALIRQAFAVFHLPWGLIVDDLESYPPARKLFEDHLDIATALLSELIAVGIAEGEFRDLNPRLVAELVIAVGRRVTRLDALSRIDMDPADVVDETILFALRGLAVDVEPGPQKQKRRAR